MTHPSTEKQAAVIYCRVSSKKQVRDGHGLESQEARCREYAQAHGYAVEAVFPDDVSGGGDFMKRPGMIALLSYLDAQPEKSYVVIFDDLKRFARDTEFHLQLRKAFRARKARVECLNFKFDDSPEGKFIETILAAQGALEREQNGRQVTQKMRARMQNGYWVFQAPVGYRYAKTPTHGKLLVPDEPVASIVTEALEAYACGRLDSQAEVKRFLESRPAFPKNGYGTVRQQEVTRLLTRPIYAGFLCHADWDIDWVKGHHEPLVSLATFEKVQERRASGTKAPARKNISEDFPLRGFVLCDDCGKPLTACWSKGKTKKYPYYLCDTRGCPSCRKSIPQAEIEGAFEEIVRSLQPTRRLIELATLMFKNAWQQRSEQTKARLAAFRKDLADIEAETERLLERIIAATNDSVVKAYETKIEQLERRRLSLTEKLQDGELPQGRFEEFIELSLKFLANPWNLWRSGRITLQRTVLRLAFSERISYSRNEGYRTPKTTLPFKTLADFSGGNGMMVEPKGVEPSTS
ncbi:MAG: recombinase family protein [Geminicoccaceae bacterium]|nr:recombinase family protein [Geminicoccaceae bacterium]